MRANPRESLQENNLFKNNHTYLIETIRLREDLEGGFLLLAKRLRVIRDERKWEGEYEDFAEFLRETRIAKSTASKLIGVYEKFVLMGGIKEEELAKVGWTNVSLFLPAIHTKEDARRIWDQTHLLDRTDAERTWKEMRTGKDMIACAHSDTYLLRVCRNCGLKTEDYEV